MSFCRSKAFTGVKSLKSITIPAGVKELPKNMFDRAESLENVFFEPNSELEVINQFVSSFN